MENKDEEIRKLFKFFEQDKMNQLHRIYLMQLLKEKFMNEILHSACFVNDNAVLDCSSRCKSRKNVDNFAKFVDFLRSIINVMNDKKIYCYCFDKIFKKNKRIVGYDFDKKYNSIPDVNTLIEIKDPRNKLIFSMCISIEDKRIDLSLAI